MTKEGGIIKLNVGGVIFMTTRSTLEMGSGFFSGLLSGRLGTLKDEQGAYFVDRNGEIFSVILEFLRTGMLSPSATKRFSTAELLAEAQFFLVESLIAILNDSQIQIPVNTPEDVLRTDGYYVRRDAGFENTMALSFRSDGRMTCAVGPSSSEHLIVMRKVRSVPRLWKEDADIEHQYATFVMETIQRGTYWVEGSTVKYRVQQTGPSNFGVVHGTQTLYVGGLPMDPTRKPAAAAGFAVFSFVAWTGHEADSTTAMVAAAEAAEAQ